MAYVRKTKYEWRISGNYGYGWDVECAEDTRKEAMARLKEYRENGGGEYKLTKHRVPINEKMKNCDDIFIRHASIAFFACAWADMVEENGHTLRGEILDQVPAEIDSAAIHAGTTLLMDMLRANGCANAGDMLDRCPDEGDRPHTIETLGHYSAMQAMGHGVGLGDAFGDHDCLIVPHVEFGSHSLDEDYF